MSNQSENLSAGSLVNRALGELRWKQWTEMWNGDLAVGREFLTTDFRVAFGADFPGFDTDAFCGPDDLTHFIGSFRERYLSLSYQTNVGPIVDIQGTTGHVSCRWLAKVVDLNGENRTMGGIDILRIDAGLVSQAWSVTGTRRLRQ